MAIHKALHPRDDIDGIYVLRKKATADTPTLKIAVMHILEDSKTILNRPKKDELQWTETAVTR